MTVSSPICSFSPPRPVVRSMEALAAKESLLAEDTPPPCVVAVSMSLSLISTKPIREEPERKDEGEGGGGGGGEGGVGEGVGEGGEERRLFPFLSTISRPSSEFWRNSIAHMTLAARFELKRSPSPLRPAAIITLQALNTLSVSFLSCNLWDF